MAMRLRSVKINEKDLEALRTTCQTCLIKDNPEMDGMKLSDRFMLHRIIDYYIRPLISLRK